MRTFNFLKILNSPFKRPRVNLYVGKIAHGTPYFLPRRSVKATPKLAIEAAREQLASDKRFNERNANNGYQKKIRTFDELYEEMKSWRFNVPKRIGFDFVGLGYKTKWSNTDYRFEWCPIWSFVFWKWQIALTFGGPKVDSGSATSHYWESWLYYQYHTKGSTQERVAQCKKDFSQTCTIWSQATKTTVNYYDIILKNKYR